MKTYKNLWNSFVSMDNLRLAAKKAIKHKKNKKAVQYFLQHQDELLKKLQDDLINNKFKTSKYKIRTIYEPKKRDIYILPLYPDHIVHHAIINIVGPIWQSTFINDSYACIPGKGLHAASRRVMHFIRKYKYVLQCDIKKFFPSINHQIMFNIVKKKIGDKKLLHVLREIVFSVGGGKNLPIGNLTSQWMANVYLNQMDHFIKEVLQCRAYIRYCDDFLIFDDDKSKLHNAKKKIEFFISNSLALMFSKSVVFPVKSGVQFVGYRHFKKFIILRKYGVRKIWHRILNILKHYDFSDNAIGQLAALHGWIRWSCSFNFKMSVFKMTLRLQPTMQYFICQKFFIS
ncbi:MAG: reverse transcriptase/maturase family protein [Alphaproteobacteria bacterium]